MPDLRLVPLTPSDEPFLWEMLYLALYVPPGQPPFARSILKDPHIACYVQGWGRDGDWGMLACDELTPVGAVWLRQWSGVDDMKGYGYVNPSIPELSIALQPDYRNLGWGTRMLETTISMAHGRYPGLSLSVVRGSPVLRLYLRLGFREVGQVMDSPVMLLEWKDDG